MGNLPIFVINEPIINNGSMAGSLTSTVIDIAEILLYSVHAIWTGTPTGSISVQGSNDGTNFVEVASQATGGAAGQYLLNIEKAGYKYVRVQFIRTGSTGSLTVYLAGKRS